MKKSAKGYFEKVGNELMYTIDNVNEMEDFFLTIPSSGDVWIFLWSKGGISAGRESAEKAIFPYYTDDKLSDMKYVTGGLEMIKSSDELWHVFDPKKENKISISMPRNLSKVSFSEKNEKLGLLFKLTWCSSEKYGLIKKIEIEAEKDAEFTLLDGARNIMPSSTTSEFQNTNSTLIDAYKKSDLDEKSGLVALSLSSVITDRAEPNEALFANVTYFTKEGRITLDPNAEEDFKNDELTFFSSSLGERGSVSLVKDISLKKGEKYECMQIFDLNYSSSRFANLRKSLSEISREELEKDVEKEIALSSEKLDFLIKDADGYEDTNDLMASVHHEANVLFNIMRGGTFLKQTISMSDFKDYLSKRNKKIYQSATLLEKNDVSYDELKATFVKDSQTRRLFYEYIPLSFSRRHGDPSRPWNKFLIKIKNENGEPILNYEGNWRDIFQNWEALSLSYPVYLDHMISRFLDTMTVDGYNPYKINRDGFDWEESDENNPWAAIGYWNDHQVIYLVRLLELSKSYGGHSLTSDLSTPRFSSSNVPYRIKSYREIEKDPHNSIHFDKKLSDELKKNAKEGGSDKKLVLGEDGEAELVSLSTKILQIIISKLANFVPDGGIWMNTQRPEWNDANNALAGFGLSVVSTSYIRLLLKWYIELLERSHDRFLLISLPVAEAFEGLVETFKKHNGKLNDKERLSFVRENGLIFETERERLYASGFGSETVSKSIVELIDDLSVLLGRVDDTLRNNKRSDGLYHSYNVLMIEGDEMKVLEMKLQLEGQVAILSSALVSGKEAVELMRALRESPLHEEITGAYTLYPNKTLPLFWEKNNIEDPKGLEELKSKDGRLILEKDESGVYHFNGTIRNKACLDEAIGSENKEAEELYEKTFNHRFFTGRSDSFFRYEGLGSIYWHMVSKLLLALAELIEKEEDEKTRRDLIKEYRTLRSSLGYKRSAASYGSFPFMPYSHTPKGKGAKQPGMTGQVKEEVISRNLELGAKVKDGVFVIDPLMLEESEFKEDGSLSYTRFGVNITYKLTNEPEVMIAINNGGFRKAKELTRDESVRLFTRDGKIKSIECKIPRRILC